MKKIFSMIRMAAGAMLLAAGLSSCSYNTMVSEDEAVTKAWGDVETSYQRRADLIPNLVSTVKGYATHEKETLEAVVNARSKATSITIDPSNCTEEQLKAFQEAQSQLSSSLSKLMAVAEAYPQLQAGEQFKELQAQLEGTENRIAEARRAYNAAVQTYNTTVRSFPTTIYAGWFGFKTRTPFQAEAGASTAPKVSF